ncbi:MAG: bifunctional riboflavin kinase/FAD synthetase [Prevotella sp.]|jgi:riboflavin kinase/FMN adenylyltransferase
MKTLYLNEPLQTPAPPCVATIGFFDGVHRGHQFLIQHVIEEARRNELASTVVTFDRHPRQILQKDFQPQLLTTLPTRLILLARTGVDQTALLTFSTELAQLTAREFMDRILRQQLNVRKLVIGYDNRFGHNRSETFDDYVRYGRELGIEVIHHTALTIDGLNVSSSVVRSLLSEGKIAKADRCLGYPYTITGKVVSGYQEGRLLGFPTANIDLGTSGQLVPANGVYAVEARLEQTMAMRPAMMNIGTRPTFGGAKRSIETHIFNFKGNIYGKQLSISFYDRIREERKFDNVAQLVEQLKKDERQVEQLFEKLHEEN